MIGRVLAFAAMASSVTGAQAIAEPRQPTGKWSVKAIGNECLLTNSYGTPADPLFLSFRKAPISGGFEMIILQNSRKAGLRTGTARIAFNGVPPIDGDYSALYLSVNPKTGLQTKTLRRIWIGSADTPFEDPGTVSALTVDMGGEGRREFALPDFARASAMVNECAVKLGERWGFSAEEQRRIAKPAEAVQDLQSYFTSKDYPSGALRDEAMGSVRVKIGVSAAGSATGCEVVGGSGNEELDATTCRVVMERARFEPATDIDGKAVRSIIVATVFWVLV